MTSRGKRPQRSLVAPPSGAPDWHEWCTRCVISNVLRHILMFIVFKIVWHDRHSDVRKRALEESSEAPPGTPEGTAQGPPGRRPQRSPVCTRGVIFKRFGTCSKSSSFEKVLSQKGGSKSPREPLRELLGPTPSLRGRNGALWPSHPEAPD